MSREQIRERVKSEAKDFVTDGLLGAREWEQSKVWYLTGFSSIAAGASKGLSGAGRSGKYTFGLIKHAFSNEKSEPLACDSSDPRVRFGAAMERYQLSENQVSEIQRRSTQMSVVWMLIVTALTVWGFYYASNESGAAGLAGFVCHLFAVPMMLRQLFWNYQLRHRSLNSFRDFVRSGDWLPFGRATAGIMIAIAAGAAMFLVPGAANAADGFSGLDFLTESASQPGTLYYELLQVLAPVGPVEPGAMQSPWAGPLSNAMRVFNVTLLSVGGAMLGWHTMSGMVSTAHEGKMLGQKWHQIWAPIRVTAGVGFLAPIAGGFSAVQILVLHVALWGSAFADLVWNAYTDSFRDTSYMTSLINNGSSGEFKDKYGNTLPRKDMSASVRAFVDSENGQRMVFALVERQVCLRGIQHGLETAATSLRNRGADIPTDLGAASPEIQATVLGAFREMAPSLAHGITVDGADNTLAFFDVLTQQPQHKIGMSKDNGTLISGFTYPAADASSKLIVDEGGTAAVTWNFGACGTMKVNPFSIKAVQEKLAFKNGDYIENQGFLGLFGDEEVDWGALSADMVSHQLAYNLIMSSAQSIGDSVDARVLPFTKQVAEKIYQSAVYLPGAENALPPQIIEAMITNPNSQLIDVMAAAYQGWLDTTAQERASVNANVYDLIETTDVEPYIDLAQAQGWAGAGSFYMILSRAQENNYSQSEVKAEFGGGFSGWGSIEARDDIKSMFMGTTKDVGLIGRFNTFQSANFDTVRSSAAAIANEFTKKQIQNESGFAAALPEGTPEMGMAATEAYDYMMKRMKEASNYFMEMLLDIVLSLEPDPYFALTEIVDFGHAIITAAQSILVFTIVAMITIKVGGGLVEGIASAAKLGGLVNGIKGLLMKFVGLIQMAAFLVFALGLVHAYILPLIPYIYFTFFTFGMVILIAEAMVAAPIWALMHVRMDGTEFVDQTQRPGYMIVFNLFLRPTLAIFGLIFSFSVFSAGIWLVNETFVVASRAVMSEGVRLTGVIVMFCVMTYMHYQIATRSFALITDVPDRVTRWFGHGAEGLGEAHDAKNTTALFVSSAEGRLKEMSGGAIGGGPKGRDKPKDGQQTKENDSGSGEGQNNVKDESHR